MDANKYLNSRTGKTIEAIKVAYMAGKRIFFLQTTDLEIVHDIVTSGSIVPYQREVRNKEDKKVIETESNVHFDNLASIRDNYSEMSTLSMKRQMPHVFIWAGEYDKDNRQEIPWKRLFYCACHYSQLTNMNLEEENFAIRKKLFMDSIVLVVLDAVVSVPSAIEPYSVVIKVPAVSESEFRDIVVEHVSRIDHVDVSSKKEFLEGLFLAMRGMTSRQIITTLNECKIQLGKIYFESDDKENNRRLMKMVRHASEQVLDSAAPLTMIQPSGVEPAGMKVISNWIEENASYVCSPKKCQEQVRSVPKGILVSGIPGSGKSMMAKYIANRFSLSLIRFDLGDVNGKFVGDSEKNMNMALSVVESLSPCVLWIDEIEKAFSGASDGHEVSKRIFGKFLTWMQEKSEHGLSCFVFATANDISKMPPEMFRSGRFDEKFFMFLPSAMECGAIFESHINHQCEVYLEMNSDNRETLPLFNNKRINAKTFICLIESDVCMVNKLRADEEGFTRSNKFFTGADIEQLIVKAKSRYSLKENQAKSVFIKNKDAVFDSEGFVECMKEVAAEMRTLGETNLDDVAVNYAKLVKCNFVAASDTVIVPFRGYNHDALYRSDKSKLYALDHENEHINKLTEAGGEYDKQLYLAVRNAINGSVSRIRENNK